MTHAAHPVTTEATPGYDGTTSWFKYSDAVEEWCDLANVNPKKDQLLQPQSKEIFDSEKLKIFLWA